MAVVRRYLKHNVSLTNERRDLLVIVGSVNRITITERVKAQFLVRKGSHVERFIGWP